MNQGLLMPRAVSKIFSVTIATVPFAVNRNPTAAQDASCHLDGVALMDPQALATTPWTTGKTVPPQAALPTRNSIEPAISSGIESFPVWTT
jgi:hypothetical protein